MLAQTRPPSSFIAALADPVLRRLATSALINALGRGVFLTLAILYFTLFSGLSATVIAIVLTVAGGTGVVASLLAGQLSDRFSAKFLLVALGFAEGAALVGLAWAPGLWGVAVLSAVAVGANRASNAVRSGVIARSFQGASRTESRAVLRTVANAGIAVGSALAGVPVLVGTAAGYQLTFVLAGCATVAGASTLLALPRTVDAPQPTSGAVYSARPAGRSPFTDRRYLALTVFAGIFAMQFGVLEVGLPIWVVSHTSAPHVIVSIALLVNTLGVILLQLPLSKGTEDIRRAGAVTGFAGIAMAAACFVYAGASGVGPYVAAAFLLIGVLLHTLAEILSSAGTWSLSFELADRARPGAYQGVFAMGFSLGGMLAPLVVTVTALDHPAVGWTILAAVFLSSAVAVRSLVRRRGEGTLAHAFERSVSVWAAFGPGEGRIYSACSSMKTSPLPNGSSKKNIGEPSPTVSGPSL